MKRLSIILTLVCSFNIFAIDTIDFVRNDLWSQFDRDQELSQLNLALGERWSEELEHAVTNLEKH